MNNKYKSAFCENSVHCILLRMKTYLYKLSGKI